MILFRNIYVIKYSNIFTLLLLLLLLSLLLLLLLYILQYRAIHKSPSLKLKFGTL